MKRARLLPLVLLAHCSTEPTIERAQAQRPGAFLSTREERCDHAALRAWVLQCVHQAGSAGDSDGVAADCLQVAGRLFCDDIVDGRSQSGKRWTWRDGWRLAP